MYESPIEIITKEMSLHFDNDIYRAVQEYGIEVDKDELIKALRYDRDQYDKGYRDGLDYAMNKFMDVLEDFIDKYPECFEHMKDLKVWNDEEQRQKENRKNRMDAFLVGQQV